MRRWDQRATQGQQIPERVLMENAGRSAARVVAQLYPEGRVVVAVGSGNNGGDAVVLLRTLRAWGREGVAVPVGGADLSDELRHGWDLRTVQPEDASVMFGSAAVLVDGILGTGARGAPREPQAAVIRAMNASERPIVSLDGPSGVDLTTGSAPGAAVRAEVTISFGAPKRGLLLYPGRTHAGRMVVVEVGFPPLREDEWSGAVITSAWARSRLPHLPPNAHKGTAGSVVVIAGRPGMAGAAVLAGKGALRAGAGGVRLVSPAENRIPLQTALPEAIFVDREGAGLDGVLEQADALVVGPGMGTDGAAHGVLERVLQTPGAPALLDADALTLISQYPELLSSPERPLLLTPHPGEASRLLGAPTGEIVADPFGFAARARKQFGCTVLLKGFPSLVAVPGEPTLVNVAGHAGIATGGMGDTLAGVAGAFLGVGCSPRDAAALALFFAGRAAELAGCGRSLLPTDVAEALPAALTDERGEGRLDLSEVVFDLSRAR